MASFLRSRIPLRALLNARKIYRSLYKRPFLLSACCVLQLLRDSAAIVKCYSSDLQPPGLMYGSLNCIWIADVYRFKRHFSFMKIDVFKLKPQLDFFFKTCVGTYPLLDKYHLFQMLLHILKPFLRAVWKDDTLFWSGVGSLGETFSAWNEELFCIKGNELRGDFFFSVS